MIYTDSSVALAYLLAELRAPSANVLRAELVSSRLLEYEVWTRVYTHPLGRTFENETRSFLAGVELIDISRPALRRSLEPWPIPLRTLDALHLATMEFLRENGQSIELASYDNRLIAAAQALGIAITAL